MLEYSVLYPVNNCARTAASLDGMWKFSFDPESKGVQDGWTEHLPNSISMPVPASFADVFTDHASRDYCGDFWYEKEFFLHAGENDVVELRFGSVAHRCTVYVNGTEICSHEGGFLPVVCDITKAAKRNALNTVVVKVNNELNESTLPCGSVMTLTSGKKLAAPYFDFFNYSGIQRSVYVVTKPQESIVDYDTSFAINGKDADVCYSVRTNGSHDVAVCLKDAEGNVVAQSEGASGVLHVTDAKLWNVRNAYLYQLVMVIRDGDTVIDSYEAKLGIRTIRIDGTKILVNDEPVYLKGFGKHEDFDILGRGFNYSIAKRDYECMKWINANCFRTSHYPYADEWYQLADEEGFLIIDEVPAVGMMRSTRNFVKAGTGGFTHFFETDTVPELLKNHKQQVEEMITRDKNHPSVFSFSLFNEPETTSKEAHDYFKAVFDHARPLDPQKRPLTGAFEKNSQPELCQVYPLCDFLCLNRYYGWYISGGGTAIEEAELKFRDEMDRWSKKNLNVPFVFTEFGTDTLDSMHKLPSIMWSQEYQEEYYERNFNVFDSYDFITGELTWNFADFQTTEGIMRVNGNKKGVFTRNRQPKASAFLLKKRWENK
ncbi:MAG: beta-glucuronidase [Solobacterium sp.]|nr:beta-glucuronidase [Solobacterium sp.]